MESMTTARSKGPRRVPLKKAKSNPGMKREKSKKPGVSNMAKSILDSASAILRKGVKPVDQEEKERRLSICRKCEHLLHPGAKFERCSQCGCVLRFKASLEAWGCPLDKW
jgi:ribosomal protein L40E